MVDIPVPYETFLMFVEKLNIDEKDIDLLEPFAPLFREKKREFAEYFYRSFFELAESRMIIEVAEKPEYLKDVWAQWFEALFSKGLDRGFHAYLWRVGLRHVDVGVDQRFSNLGFSLVRQFCHRIIVTDIPEVERPAVTMIVDSLIDLCLLIETSAFIEATTRCDLEVIKGIADRVRNPVTIIGGTIRRLQKKAEPMSHAHGVYEDLISQTTRLEQMVLDIKAYNEMFGRKAEFTFVHPEAPLRTALERLGPRLSELQAKVETDLGALPFIKADRRDIDQLFYHLLQNSIEAIDRQNPMIRISSSPEDAPPRSVKIEIFNTGIPPKAEDLSRLESPFFSTKPEGTGFGLAIAHLAARRNFGKVSIEPVAGQGTRVVIIFPAAP